ncbi:MAG: sensor domain-containing diguanylate cyclase [Deltaproteobacteria bacterium]|nr:sensor domain-containing diguanylate cyclase [Deltaproteobacteria bacterium]
MKYDFQQIVDNLFDGLYVVDNQRIITYWNKAAERITGYGADEVIGFSCKDDILVHVDDKGVGLCRGLCPLARTLRDSKVREAEVFLHHKAGHRVPVWVRITPLKDQDGRVIGAAELFTDLSNQSVIAERMRELEKLATLDRLTGLPNRNHIEPEIDVRLQEFRRYATVFGVMFCDIDRFKTFNDTYGHDVGDMVLKTVSNTLKHNIRPFDVIGRWGGEEFVGVVRNVDRDTLCTVGERWRMLVEKTYISHHGATLNVTVSIGATLAQSADTVETIVKRADQFLYESKHNGRNRLTAEGQTCSGDKNHLKT